MKTLEEMTPEERCEVLTKIAVILDRHKLRCELDRVWMPDSVRRDLEEYVRRELEEETEKENEREEQK